MLALQVHFLTGRYYATAHNDRAAPEWPPHPARLFSAMAAAHFAPPAPPEAERAALLWLEQQGPPEIQASDADGREVVTVFVPVNDTSVTGDLEADFEELRALRLPVQAGGGQGGNATPDGRALAKLGKGEARFAEKVRKSVAVPDRAAKAAVREAARVLPDGRGRQPRTLPSVTPRVPRVLFLWPDASLDSGTAGVLDHIASRVVRLGHSSSLVAVRVVEPDSVRGNWNPTDDGTARLRVVGEGQLARLESEFARSRETEPRILPSRSQTYGEAVLPENARIPTSVFGSDWIVLRRISGPRLPATAGPGLARLVRRILVRFAEEPVVELISGHRPDSTPSQVVHSAIVPLPFVGSDHADGSLLGVAIIPPRDASSEERRALYAALGRWEIQARNDRGLGPDDPDPILLPIHMGEAGVLDVVIEERTVAHSTLRSRTWCSPSRIWVTASPIALDRNPGDLRSRDPERRRKAFDEAEESIRVGIERIGLPRPDHVIVLPSVPLVGAAKARRYPPFPDGPSKAPRILTHARIEFAEPVSGPIVVGAGRYHGLGLFRPLWQGEAPTKGDDDGTIESSRG